MNRKTKKTVGTSRPMTSLFEMDIGKEESLSVLFIGEVGVGKTSVIQNLCADEFKKPVSPLKTLNIPGFDKNQCLLQFSHCEVLHQVRLYECSIGEKNNEDDLKVFEYVISGMKEFRKFDVMVILINGMKNDDYTLQRLLPYHQIAQKLKIEIMFAATKLDIAIKDFSGLLDPPSPRINEAIRMIEKSGQYQVTLESIKKIFNFTKRVFLSINQTSTGNFSVLIPFLKAPLISQIQQIANEKRYQNMTEPPPLTKLKDEDITFLNLREDTGNEPEPVRCQEKPKDDENLTMSPQHRAEVYLSSKNTINGEKDRDLSQIYYEDGYLDFDHKITEHQSFYDGGASFPPIRLDTSLSDFGIDFNPRRRREILLIDLEHDKDLIQMVNSIKTRFEKKIAQSLQTIQTRWLMKSRKVILSKDEEREYHEEVGKVVGYLEKIILIIVTMFGGNPPHDPTPLSDYGILEERLHQKMFKKKSNVFLLSELIFKQDIVGICRHRSILMKLVCDSLGLPCRLLRGWFSSIESKNVGVEKHAWNIILIGNELFLADLTTSCKMVEEVNYQNYVRINKGSIGGIGGFSIEKIDEKWKNNPIPLKRMYEKHQDIHKLIAVGGFAKIIQIGTGTSCAVIKEINITGMSQIYGRPYMKYAQREANYMSIMKHKNIMGLIDSFRVDKKNGETLFCIVMKKMMFHGDQLMRFFKRLKRHELNHPLKRARVLVESLIFFSEVAEGVMYLHSKGLVHYDLKLKNVLLDFDKKKFRLTDVRIIDFGGAKEIEKLRNHSQFQVSLANTAPEIVTFITRNAMKRDPGELYLKYPRKVDVFSFGRMMMEFQFIFQFCPAIMNIICGCLQTNPGSRPSMSEIFRALQREIIQASKTPDSIVKKDLKKKNAQFGGEIMDTYEYQIPKPKKDGGNVGTQKTKREDDNQETRRIIEEEEEGEMMSISEPVKDEESNSAENSSRINQYLHSLDLETATDFNPEIHFKKRGFLDFHHKIHCDPFVLTEISKKGKLRKSADSISLILDLRADKRLQLFFKELKRRVSELPSWEKILSNLQQKKSRVSPSQARLNNPYITRSSPQLPSFQPQLHPSNSHQQMTYNPYRYYGHMNINPTFYQQVSKNIQQPSKSPNPLKKDHMVKKYLSVISECVANFFGGTKRDQISNLQDEKNWGDDEILRVSENLHSNAVPIGSLERAYVRPRALLFKFACDVLGIKCRYLSGWDILSSFDPKSRKVPWNIVKVFHKFYMVDLMTNFKVSESLSDSDYVNSGGSKDHTIYRKKMMNRIKQIFMKESKREFIKGGSFSQVWRLKKEDLNDGLSKNSPIFAKDVAIKVIDKADIQTQWSLNFNKYIRKEVDFMTFTSHRNIIHALGTFPYRNRLDHKCVSIVMDYYPLNGRHLYYELKENVHNARKRTTECLVYLLEIAHGLQYIHSQNIIHLDLKPENILIQWDKKKQIIEKLVITDFAGSKDRSQNMLKTVPFITLKYAPQEVIQLKEMLSRPESENTAVKKPKVSEKVDVYSFGGILRELIEEEGLLRGYAFSQLSNQCRHEEPEKRLNIIQIISTLRTLLFGVKEGITTVY